MNSVSFEIVQKKNTGLILNPTELKDLYFYGIDIQSGDFTTISDETYATYIASAQEVIEKFLNIKIIPQKVEETKGS